MEVVENVSRKTLRNLENSDNEGSVKSSILDCESVNSNQEKILALVNVNNSPKMGRKLLLKIASK